MTRQVVTALPDDTAADVKRILESRRLHHLVVVDHGCWGWCRRDLSSAEPVPGPAQRAHQDAHSLNRKVHRS